MQTCKPSRMPRSKKEMLESSPLYIRLKKEEDEINRHKWVESEKAGRDMGWNYAMIDWITKHKSKWMKDMKESGLLD